MPPITSHTYLGLNATVTGPKEAVVEFTNALRGFDECFKETDFKFVDDMPLDRAFADLKVWLPPSLFL